MFLPLAENGMPFGGSMQVMRRSLPALRLSIGPFMEQAITADGREYALLVITDQAANEDASRSLLRSNYQLTDAEIRLSLLLAKGHSMNETAAATRHHTKHREDAPKTYLWQNLDKSPKLARPADTFWRNYTARPLKDIYFIPHLGDDKRPDFY